MRAIFETLFDIVYLVTVITIGIRMIRGSKGNRQFQLFGWMAVVLGAGDSFHLVPRALALCTTGFDAYAVQLYFVWRERYQVKNHVGTTAAIFALAAMRVALCMLLQNQWLTNQTPLEWGILRNIPFAIMGLMVIVLFYRSAKEDNDEAFRWMWLTIVLSFGFYIPVILWAEVVPAIGMLMIPKTCAYVWTVLIGYNAMKKEC